MNELLAVYGPLFDDVIGTEDRRVRRHASLACLLSVLFHFLCRVFLAVIFGAFDLESSSRAQIWLLITIQSLHLSYLLYIRPYANRVLMLVESICNFCEWGILITALVILETGQTAQVTSTMLLSFAYVDIGALMLYEVIRMARYIRQACPVHTKPSVHSMDAIVINSK